MLLAEIDVHPLELLQGQLRWLFADLIDFALALDVADDVLLDVVAEGGTVVPVGVGPDEVFVESDEFAVGPA